MTYPLEQRRYTEEEYLQLEEQSQEKHEYWDGHLIPLSELLAMAGGTYEHSLISINVARAIGNRLAGGPCRVLGSDMRVKIPRSPRYCYPDASIVCGQPQFQPSDKKRLSILNPRAIVEVLSEGTEAFDRTKKFHTYLKVPSLEEYILVSQKEARVESYFRQSDGGWLFNNCEGIDSVLKIHCVNIEIPMSEIYLDVEFPPVAEDEEVTE
jgi:Uma2 family endonuclease